MMMSQPPAKQNNILVVDDIAENLSILTQILTQKGYLVRPAINSQIALKAIQKALPDLILLDIMLPDMDGYELCRQLKADAHTRDIAVVFISARVEDVDKIKAFEVGGVDYITKPFQIGEVLARVATHLALRNSQKQLQMQNVRLQQELGERQQAEEALQRSNHQLLLLNQVGQLVSSSLELEHVLATALSEIQRLLDAFSASFWLLDAETGALVCRQVNGPGSETLLHWRLAVDQGITGWAAEHGESVLVADTWEDARHFRTVDEQTGVAVRSLISIPLRMKGDVIGVLNLVDPRVRHFTKADLIFLEPIAAASAIAIENARLYATAQQEIAERKRAEDALTESVTQIQRAKQEWESTADSLSYVVCLLDHHGKIIRVNRFVEQWALGNVVEAKGRGLHELFHPGCADAACYLKTFLAYAWEEVAQGLSIGYEAEDRILQRYLSIQIRPISAPAKGADKLSASFAVGVISDISERKWAEAWLQQRNHELALLNQMSDALQRCATEAETYPEVVTVCRQLFPGSSGYLALTDASRARLTVADAWGQAPPPANSFGLADCCALRDRRFHVVEAPAAAPLCAHVPVFPEDGYLCAPIITPQENLGILSLAFGPRDPFLPEDQHRQMLKAKWLAASRLVEYYALSLVNLRLRETLRLESIRDPLTDLYNRRYMEESLEREVRRAQRNHSAVGIMMLDIDHFKRLNDTHGHKAGDAVLQALGALLQNNVRGGDIVCRYGGEEFLLILPDAALPVAQRRAEELLAQIRALQIPYQQTIFQITVSIGVATFFAQTANVQEVINAADHALYQAKAHGRNQVALASAVAAE